MADVVEAVRSYLLAEAAVTNLIGQRMYFDRLPQNPTLPAATISKTSETHEHDLSDRTGFISTRFQIECTATLRLTANDIAKQIRKSGIVALKGETNSIDIRGVQIEDGERNFTVDARDGGDDHQYVTTFDLMVQYLET